MVDDDDRGLRGGGRVKQRGKLMRFPQARVYVRTLGEGHPLLLINGLGAHSAMWETLERSLPDFRIVEFDLPGAGQSDTPWKPVSVKQLAALSTSIMDHFEMDRPDVLGYSMGGIVAQQLAADFPERVRRLVLLATSPGMGQMQGDMKAFFNIMTPLRYMSRHAYVKTIGSLVGGRARYDRRWIAEQGALRLKHSPSWRGYCGQLFSLARWTGLPLLGEIKHPALVVTGDDDPLTPVVNGMMLAHMLPNGRLLVCPGEGHLIAMDADSVAHPAIREFLTAPRLDRAKAWNSAKKVTAEELQIALFSAPFQVPPLSILNARARSRWLPFNHTNGVVVEDMVADIDQRAEPIKRKSAAS
jgi:pimeloyl-ACP methyl ester carboxylesterase